MPFDETYDAQIWDSIASTRKLIRNLRAESREDDAVLNDELQELRAAINDLIVADRAIHNRIERLASKLEAKGATHA